MVHALTISPIFDLSIRSQGIDDDFFSRFTESQHQKDVQPLGKFERCGKKDAPSAVVREIRLNADPQVELGSEVKATIFAAD